MFLVFIALILANEIEDGDQKKRGAGKANPLNAIPTGAQKPDYTYNIYQQSPSASNIPSQNYQSQAPNSFYPNQESSTYYSSANSVDTASSHPTQTQTNYSPQPVQSQFIPINFIPSPGYQSKYQIIPTKSSIQLAFLQQPQYHTSPIAQYPHSLYSPTPSSHITPPNIPLFNSFGSPGYNIAPHFQPYSLAHGINQPSAMILLPQTNPSLYNNLVYPNPSQSFYNYYPSQSQAKYSYSSGAVGTDYEKGQTSVSQNIPKEDNDVSVQNSEYITPSDTNNGYKSSYSRRSTYNKLK